MNITEGINNIIFDWGGVIINIDYTRTRQAFIDLGVENFDEVFSQYRQIDIFDKLDTGKISGERFFEELQKLLPGNISTEDLRSAWNAMLLDFPAENFELLKEMKEKYRTFLFSNTNEPHLSYYFPKVEEKFGIPTIDPLFEKAYYSCRFGMRKPDPESFAKILEENELIASETLFIDDSPQHLEGASKTGIKTYHLKHPEKLTDIFYSES
jgi:putative hydrolase of the HAD superfamily